MMFKKNFFIVLFVGVIHTLPLYAEHARIISLAPAITSSFYDLHAEDQLIATTATTTPIDQQKPLIGDAFFLNIEKIITLKPTLILAVADFTPETQLQQIRALHIPLKIFPALHSWDNIVAMFQAVAEETNSLDSAKKILRHCAEQRATISRQSQNQESQNIFVEISLRPLMSIGRLSFLQDMLTDLNLKPLFATTPLNAFAVSAEHVVLQKPLLILDVSLNLTREEVSSFWKELLPTAKIVVINDKSTTLATPLAYIEALQLMSDRIKKTYKGDT